MLKLSLDDDRWNLFLAKHEDDRFWLEREGTKQVREALLKILDTLSDIDIEALRTFEGRSARRGWEYLDFRKTLRRNLPDMGEHEDPLGELEDCGLLDVCAREDAGGPFVAVESSQIDYACLLRALLRTDVLV